jgi:nucleoside-diphosphate-sugar epimerase
MDTNASEAFRGKRLVVFGAGYVGGAVAREGVARGMRVTALTRNTEKASELVSAGVDVVVEDFASDRWHARIAGGADFVLNAVSSGGGGIDGYRHSYLGGMTSLTTWLDNPSNGAGVTVYTSSTSVYSQGGGVVVDENMPVDMDAERPRVLVEAEAMLRGLPAERTRVCVLRLAGIYGPQRHHLIEQVRSGEVAGRGGHRLNLIHRDDACRAIWQVFGAPGAHADVFNLADDGATTKAEVASWLATRLGVESPRFTGEPAAGRRAITPDRVISNAKIKRALGWAPQYATFREGYSAILGA